MKDKRFKHPSIYIFDLLERVIEIWHFLLKIKILVNLSHFNIHTMLFYVENQIFRFKNCKKNPEKFR